MKTLVESAEKYLEEDKTDTNLKVAYVLNVLQGIQMTCEDAMEGVSPIDSNTDEGKEIFAIMRDDIRKIKQTIRELNI